MSVIKNLEIKNSEASFDICVYKDEYLVMVDKYQNEYIKDVKVDGFRPGKVPKEIALQQIDLKAFENTIIQRIVRETSKPAFDEITTKLEAQKRVLLSFAYDTNEEKAIREDEEQNFIYSCIALLLPPIDLDIMENLELKIEDNNKNFPKYEDFENSQIRTLMKEINTFEDQGSEAKDGDIVIISFTGEMDGESCPELSSDQYTLLLGSNEFLPQFENEIQGLKKDDIKTFDTKFPDDYFSPKFVNKNVVFTVTIKEVKTPKYSSIKEILENSPENKEALGSEEDIKELIKYKYKNEQERNNKELIQKKVVEALIRDTPDFEISSNTVNKQTDRLFFELIENSKKEGLSIGSMFLKMGFFSDNTNIENLDSLAIRSEVEKNVKDELKLQLIYLTVIKSKKLDLPSEKELDTYISQIKSSPKLYGYPENVSNEELKDMLIDNLSNRKALDYLIDKITNKETEELKEETKEEVL